MALRWAILRSKSPSDSFLGIAAGGGFALLYMNPKKDLPARLCLAVCLFMLTMAKEVGMMLAAFLAAAWILQELPGRKEWTENRKSRIHFTGAVLLAVLSIAVPKAVWKIALRVRNVCISFSQPVDPKMIWSLLTFQDASWRSAALRTYAKAFMTNPQAIGSSGLTLTYPILLAGLALLLVLLHHLLYGQSCEKIQNSANAGYDKKEEKKSRIPLILVTAMTCAYAVGQAFIYIFKFGESGSMLLLSFDRYLRVPFLAMLTMAVLMAMCTLIRNNLEKGRRLTGCLILTVGMLLLLPAPETYSFLSRESVAESVATRAPYNELAEQVLEDCGGKPAKVYVISQPDSGWQYYMLRSLLRPCLTTGWILHPDGEAYEGVRLRTAEEWREELQNYDYVLLYGLDDLFRKEYASLFLPDDDGTISIPERTVFRVDHTDGLLIPIQQDTV